jgi:hypothetical protein
MPICSHNLQKIKRGENLQPIKQAQMLRMWNCLCARTNNCHYKSTRGNQCDRDSSDNRRKDLQTEVERTEE